MSQARSDSPRKIIHVDMDCFYAAIEMRDDPSLRGRPVAVGGDPGRRGVLTTCNYEARRYGLHSAMASARAVRLCPDLVLLPVAMDKYRAVSRAIQAVFREFTDRVEPLSLDEAYLDVTDATAHSGSATLIAEALRRRIREEQDLTASAGVAPNKFLAKVASDWNKPDGLFVIRPQDVAEFVRALPVKRIPGVGKVTQHKMQGLGIATCADLQRLSRAELIRHFGAFGQDLYALARGQDERPVCVEHRRKSLSVEETFEQDLPDAQACTTQLPMLLAELQGRLARLRDRRPDEIQTLFVKMKFDDFRLTTIQSPERGPRIEVYARLLREAWERRRRPVRLIGVGVQFRAVDAGDGEQMELGL